MCNIWKRPRLYGCLISENQRFKEEKGRGRVWNRGYHKLEGRSDKNGEKCFKKLFSQQHTLKKCVTTCTGFRKRLPPTLVIRPELCASCVLFLPCPQTLLSAAATVLAGRLASGTQQGGALCVLALLFSTPPLTFFCGGAPLEWRPSNFSFICYMLYMLYVIQHKSCLDGNHNGCKKEWLRERES